jgi:hypothetical protein
MNKPTKILAPPWYDTCPKAGKKAVIILTDAGEMTLAVASELTGVDKDALWYRVIRCGKDAWKDEDIFDQERAKKKRKLDNTRRTEPIGNGKPGKLLTVKIGTWERRWWIADKYRREQTVKALPGMDQDYNSQLRLNRMMAR